MEAVHIAYIFVDLVLSSEVVILAFSALQCSTQIEWLGII